ASQPTGSARAGAHAPPRAAPEGVRQHRPPAFLHLSVVRLGGHAGADPETAYRESAEITADLAADPLIGTAWLLIDAGLLAPGDVLDRYEASRAPTLHPPADMVPPPRLLRPP